MNVTQEEKMLGGLAHVAVLFNLIGVAFLAVLTLAYRQKSRYVFEHAAQGLGLWLTGWALKLVIGAVFGTASFAMVFNPFMWREALGGFFLAVLLLMAVGITILVLVIIAAVKGFSGQPHRYPIIGDFVASLSK